MKLNLTDDQVTMIIRALKYFAHNEAGQTQAPDLCEPCDYLEHLLAVELQRRYSRAVNLRDQWDLNIQTGERVRKEIAQ